MFYQKMPRKGFLNCVLKEDEGFFIEGNDYKDCVSQLSEWAAEHPEKWIYFHNCGIGPAYPAPVAKYIFEVSIYDAEPAALMMFSTLFQKGCDGSREIDSMSEKERAELAKKQMFSCYMLGSIRANSTTKMKSENNE